MKIIVEPSHSYLLARKKMQEKGFNLVIPRRIKKPCPFIFGRAISLDPDLNIQFCSGSSAVLDEKINTKLFKEKKEFKLSKDCYTCNVLPLCLGGCPIRKEKVGLACIPEKLNIKEVLETIVIKILTYDLREVNL